MMIILALTTICFFLCFVLILGYVISSRGYNHDGNPVSLQIGMAYFFGIASWIGILRIVSLFVTDAGVSILITLAFTFTFLFYYRDICKIFIKTFISKRKIFHIFFVFLTLSPFVLIYWLPLTLTPDDVNALLGSLHSGRYVALSNYILACDFVPIIGQNIGQSLLVASISYLSLNFPFLYLFVFLLFSVGFLSLFIYGLIYKVSGSVNVSIFSSLVFMMGNSALSFAHVMTIDSGSPFLLNGYTDTLLGVFVVIMLGLFFVLPDVTFKNKWTLLLIGLLLNVSFISAPQNIVIFSIILFLCTSYLAFRDKVINFKALWLVLLLSFCISIPEGGMLTPGVMQQTIPLVGVQSVKNSQTGIRFDPWIPFYITVNSNWPEGSDQTRWFGGQGIFTVHKDTSRYFSEIIYYYEQTLFMGLRNLFFPIFGVFILFFLYKKKVRYKWDVQDFVPVQSLVSIGVLSLILGFTISYPIILNSYKLELSRFLIPGITIGLLCFVLAIGLIYRHENSKLKYFLLILGVISIVGPISNSFNRVYVHLSDYKKLPFHNLLDPGEAVYDNMCTLPSKSAENRKISTEKVILLGLAPLAKITLGKHLVLDIKSGENVGKGLISLGILLSDSGLHNPGFLELQLKDEFDNDYRKNIPSRNIKENQYNFFDLEPVNYVSARLTSLQPGHIVPWSARGDVCLALNYDGHIDYTHGCPKGIE
jgi:hypothetical protein